MKASIGWSVRGCHSGAARRRPVADDLRFFYNDVNFAQKISARLEALQTI
jgi:hypothetical protein